MTEEEFKNLKPGQKVICTHGTGNAYLTGKVYIYRGVGIYATSLGTRRDEFGSKTNGMSYQNFEIFHFDQDFKKILQ